MVSFEDLGLSKNESIVYDALLNFDLSSAKPIIEKSGLHRQLVYDALDSLITKGLVSYVIQAKRKYFKAASPRNFMTLFENKQAELTEQKNAFKEILPDLIKRQKNVQMKQDATLFYGVKGIKSLFDDMLDEKKEILTIGASDVTAEAFAYHLKFNLPKFHKIRINKKIKLQILFSTELKKRASEFNNLPFSSARVLPPEFSSNSSTNIYGNKISIILWGSQPFGILINSKEISDSKRKHFKLLWSMAKRV
ncbi:hypothetical protein HOK51_02665 [Candidatus Woesearchaeota archaeon]|nr:hypothetical protein [Candidatus Woesearchaeota archaeon]MBT6518720.1 hypothetical protein [Candidatus Woesearchaeota archaeon]MBT7367891.1 hypothetical protein [Candidatus Woesearchaeota archaeon]